MLQRWARLLGTLVLVCTVGCHALPVQAKGEAPYEVVLWADALFGTDGRLERLGLPEGDSYPKAFLDQVRQRLANARIPPVTDAAGAPATFQTGLALTFEVSPMDGGGTVRMLRMAVAPRRLKTYAASAPAETPGDGQAEVTLLCVVGIDGRCGEVRILRATAGSESFRRWGVESMQGWQFEPQRVNGQPVPGEVTQTLSLTMRSLLPQEFRWVRR